MTKAKTIVVGLGNPILTDDSVGIRVARTLQSKLTNEEEISVVEASIAGLDFLDLLAGYDKAIIIDAIQTGEGRIGEIYRLEPGMFKTTRHATTPHDVTFATALELGKKLNMPLPKQIVIFGIEVEDVTTLSEECTPEVERVIPLCVERVIKEIEGDSE